MKSNICAILTDFGNIDNFVSVMKGVMLKIMPGINFIDISHNIPQADIYKAHFQLLTAFEYMPDCVYLVVVDPGVGSNRKNIVVKYKNSYFVGPDNGVFTHFINTGEKVYGSSPFFSVISSIPN